MNPHQVPKSNKTRNKFIRIRLDPPVELALSRLRKIYFNSRGDDAEMVIWVVAQALMQWQRLGAAAAAERNYIWDEFIEDPHEFRMRKVQALWERIERRLS